MWDANGTTIKAIWGEQCQFRVSMTIRNGKRGTYSLPPIMLVFPRCMRELELIKFSTRGRAT